MAFRHLLQVTPKQVWAMTRWTPLTYQWTQIWSASFPDVFKQVFNIFLFSIVMIIKSINYLAFTHLLMRFFRIWINLCEDFYSFACGGFEKNHMIPDDQSSVTTFTLIDDTPTGQVHSLVEKPIKEDEAAPFKLVKTFYQPCLNKSI